MPQYYIEHSHEAIIDPDEWEAVQEEIKRRKAIGRAYSSASIFSARSSAATVADGMAGIHGTRPTSTGPPSGAATANTTMANTAARRPLCEETFI